MSTLKHEYCTVDVNVQKERSKRITVPSLSLLGCTFVSTLFSSIFYWSGLEYCIVHFGNNPPPGPAGTQESSSCWASAYMNRSSEVIHLTASSMRETGTVQDSNNTVATRTKPERTDVKYAQSPSGKGKVFHCVTLCVIKQGLESV